MPSEKERITAYRRTIAIIAVIALLALSYLIIQPFVVSLISALVLAYLFYPVYRWLNRLLPKFFATETIAAFLTLLLIFMIVIVPLGVVIRMLTDEIRSGYTFIQRLLANPDGVLILPQGFAEWTSSFKYLKQPLFNLAGQAILWLQGAVSSIPGHFINLLITIFAIYYFLKGGRNIYRFCQDHLPLPEGKYKQIFKKFGDLSRGYLLGQIVVGVVQGALAWGVFVYLKVPNPVLWGVLTALVSMIPLLGAALIWAPITIYLFVLGSFTNDYSRAISLLVFGVFVISLIDNLLKPKIVGDSAQIHPLIILLGILGGLPLLGLPGILIGPLVLALFDVVLDIYREVV